MNLDTLGLSGLAISDFTAWVGWLATIMLTLNLALGILQPLRYDSKVRWPRRRLPASLFKLHKWVGYSALGVVIVHPLFLLAHAKKPFSLAAIYVPFTAPAETLLAGIGTISFYLLLLIVVTSYLRLKIGLRLWKQIHYAAYVLLPMFLTHGLFVNSSLNEAVPIDYFDTGKFIVEGCAILSVALVIWRLAYHRRSRRMDLPTITQTQRQWSGQLELVEMFHETPNIRTFRFMAGTNRAIPFTFSAGQYVKLAGIRNYTISSAPEEQSYIEVTTRREEGGFFSNYMHDHLKVGSNIAFRGPFGRFTFNGGEAENVVLIAGGIGVTPFLSVLRHLAASNWRGDVSLLYLVRKSSDIIRADELAVLVKAHPNVAVRFFFSQEGSEGSNDPVGRMTASALRDLIPAPETTRVYLCGPVLMILDVAQMLRDFGVPSESIIVESFGEAMPRHLPEALPTAQVNMDKVVGVEGS